MNAEEKQTLEVTSTSSKLKNTNPVFKHHEQFQRADNLRLCKKVLDELEYSNRKKRYLSGTTNLSSQSVSAINTEELSISSIARINLDSCKHDALISRSNIIKQFNHSSWKYKNPYSVSVSNYTHYGKSSYTSENILKEDEPQEGKKKRNVISDCREYLANYHESCGTPRTEYSFAALIIVMAQTTARSLWALLYMLINVAPVIQMFSFILRFVLDKVLNIRRTKNLKQVMIKFAIFAVQLLSVYVFLIFIFGSIIFPILQMIISIVAKLKIHN